MNTSSFKNKKVLVMGLGLQGGGIGSASYFVKAGAEVTVTDLKSAAELASSLKLLERYPIRFVLGKHDINDFLTSDLIIKNPDVRFDNEFIKKAMEKKIPVEMEESLFLQMTPAKSIGVTGTRGKSTVSRIVYETLKDNHWNVFLGGNMKGSRTLEILDTITEKDWAVLELSSWQLSAITKSPQISLITNIYPDHLNRYPSMTEYIEDKKNILRHQNKEDILILNAENKITKEFAAEAKGQVIFFRKSDWPENWPLKLPGEHNRANAAAVWKLAQILKLDNEITKHTIQTFPGLEYRLQKVAQVGGVSFINDSTATTPIATVSAINSFPHQEIVLILGGNDKNLPVEEMVKSIKEKVKYVVLLKGSGTEKIVKILEKDPALNEKFSAVFSDYYLAIQYAFSKADNNGVVLLSPGFTSFAMFNNEFERASLFNDYAKKLAQNI